MKTAIYGAGSLGTVLGAYLSRAGAQVDLINRNTKHVEALRQNGAKITGTVSMTVPVTAMTPDEMHEQYDLILLMTKQLDNKQVVTSLQPFLKADGVICTMQNGLPEPSIAEIIGEDRVMGCTVAWGATMLGPGVCELTSEPDSLSFGLGRMNGQRDDKLLAVAELLEKMCPVEIEQNFMGVRWSKLLINAAFSGMSAVLGCTFGEVAKDSRSRLCAQYVIKECVEVAWSMGVNIEPVQGKDIVKLLYFNNRFKRAISSFIMPLSIKQHSKLKASMLQDLEKGKKTEVDAINGVVSRYGKQNNVSTPYNDKIVEIIHSVEAGERPFGPANIELFAPLKK